VNIAKTNVYKTNINNPSTSVLVQNVETGTYRTEPLSSVSGTGNLVLVGNFYNLIGSQYTDVLTGNKLNNVIYGGGGAKDKLTGSGGVNFLFGNSTTKFGPSAGVDYRTRKGKDPFIPVPAWNGGNFVPSLIVIPQVTPHAMALPPAVVSAVAQGITAETQSLF
jgi:hypothetical protein